MTKDTTLAGSMLKASDVAWSRSARTEMLFFLTPCCAFPGVLFAGSGYRHKVVLGAKYQLCSTRSCFTISCRCTKSRVVATEIGRTRSHSAHPFARNAFPRNFTCFASTVTGNATANDLKQRRYFSYNRACSSHGDFNREI